MRISQMVRMQDFDINKLFGLKSAKKPVAPSPAKVPYAQPNWNKIPTKGGTTRTQEELEKAIVELAQKEAANGILAGTNARYDLQREFVSLVSPDRKSLFAKYDGVSGALFGVSVNAYGGRELMIYSSVEKTWSTALTKSEMDMYSKFNGIYTDAYLAYEAEHGKVVGTPTVRPGKLDVTV